MFFVNGSSPIPEAMPDWEGPPVLRFPTWSQRALDGRPVLAVGWPTILLRRAWISSCGLRWWLQLFEGSAPYARVELTAFDPISACWTTASGVLWRPSWERSATASALVSRFEMRFIATCF